MHHDTVNVALLLDREIKKDAETLFNELGVNLTPALDVFVCQSRRLGKILFEVADPFYGDRSMDCWRDAIVNAEAGKLKKHALIEA